MSPTYPHLQYFEYRHQSFGLVSDQKQNLATGHTPKDKKPPI
jgi:hypothetical protein